MLLPMRSNLRFFRKPKINPVIIKSMQRNISTISTSVRHSYTHYNTKRKYFVKIYSSGKEKANVSPTKKNRGEFALVPNSGG